MTAKGVFYVSILVSDLPRSRTFYSETLGWKLGTDEEMVAGFHFGTGYLVVLQDHRDRAARRYAGGMHVAVQVADIEAEFSRLKDAGIQLSELRDQPWGERSFTFEDPDGYVWSYGQVRGDA